jgi:uncharacterized protein YqgC (DUF456 family)
MGAFWYHFWAVVFVVLNFCALLTNVFTLPGNWIIAVFTVLFALLVRGSEGMGLNWWCVGVVIGLAVLGEVIEFAAGAAGAAKSGGSRRGMVLAVVGAMGGSILGAILGTSIPVPLIGNLIGAVLGGAVGAFGGAYTGEYWKGKTERERLAVGTAAMIGRVLGTVGKLGIGAIMVVITAIDAFIN